MNSHKPAGSLAPRPKESAGYLGSPKLQSHHLDRTAIVYVRQSSMQQVLENPESTARQYALVDRAAGLGWSPDRIDVIDEDQGQSGATAEGRLGFQRLLAEVSLDHVGIVLGIEMSRLARSNRDWHQLIEVCAIFRTLLADQDGLYDPTDHNDRLLLGLTGIMSEAELHILRSRMYQAVLNKARRGELYLLPPVGYVKLPTGEFAIDPDEQAQSVIRLIFEQFDRLGTVRSVVRYLVENGITLPIRPHEGPNRGQLEWHRPTRDTVSTVITHPLYAGTYRYGYRQVDPRRKKPGQQCSGRVVMAPEDYHAFIPNHCPAYISLERYQRNQERMAENRTRAESKGPPREGRSLLGGIIFCGRCGLRMAVQYNGRSQTLRYACRAGIQDCQHPSCQSLSGDVLDKWVVDKIMAALEPSTLELSLRAADDIKKERERLEESWQQQLERARYKTERIERQYQAVEPENRLVVRELERRWEAALQEQRKLEHKYTRFCQTHPQELTSEQRQAILALSTDLPALWNASTTSSADRQRIVRLLLERIIVNIQGSSNIVDVSLHWSGGFVSQHEVVRPVSRYDQTADYNQLIARIDQLRTQGLSLAKIAEQLNRDGFRPVKQAVKFHSDIVGRIVKQHEHTRPGAKAEWIRKYLGKNEWSANDLATELNMPKNTLFAWIKRGWVRIARRLPGYRGRLICWADAEELVRLRRLQQTRHGWWAPPLPTELTTPKTPKKG